MNKLYEQPMITCEAGTIVAHFIEKNIGKGTMVWLMAGVLVDTM